MLGPASQNRVGKGAPKLPHRFPLIVHHLTWLRIATDGSCDDVLADRLQPREERLGGLIGPKRPPCGKTCGRASLASSQVTGADEGLGDGQRDPAPPVGLQSSRPARSATGRYRR